jgi:hypothetical protein
VNEEVLFRFLFFVFLEREEEEKKNPHSLDDF